MKKYFLLLFFLATHHHIYSAESKRKLTHPKRQLTHAEILGNISPEQRNKFKKRQPLRKRNGSLSGFQKLGPIEETGRNKKRVRVRRRVRVRTGSAPATVLEDITSQAVNLQGITSKIVALEQKMRESSKRTATLENLLEKTLEGLVHQIDYLDGKIETFQKQHHQLLKAFINFNDNIIPLHKEQQNEHRESINEHGEFLKFMLECLIPLIKKDKQQTEAVTRFSSLLGGNQ